LNELLKAIDLDVEIRMTEGLLHPVRNVSFSLGRGETLGIVGESGCGKSLTSLAVMGLLPRSAARRARHLSLAGQDLLKINKRDMAHLRGNKIAMIFQEPMTSLNPCYSVGNQLVESLHRHGKVGVQEASKRAIYLLERTGITAPASRLKQYPHQLSGGLRQRVMIAMALMCRPEVIIADEPTTALDVTIQAQILGLLAEIQKETGIGMIFISHNLGIVSRIAEKVMVMYAGEVVETGSTVDVFTQPLHPYTQGLLDCIPVPGRTKRGTMLGYISRARCPARWASSEGAPLPAAAPMRSRIAGARPWTYTPSRRAGSIGAS